jgi:hypothetical protein
MNPDGAGKILLQRVTVKHPALSNDSRLKVEDFGVVGQRHPQKEWNCDYE